jgi:hypothetical protein
MYTGLKEINEIQKMNSGVYHEFFPGADLKTTYNF